VPKDRNGIAISSPLKPVGANPLSQKVWKKGRTTGLTRGIVNGLKFVTVGEGEELPNTWALVVIGTESNRFSDKGDSGAMVVTNGGEIIGVLHSGHLVRDLTYVTPYDVLVKDIEQVTKMEVVWT
jgi:Peptidase family S64